jgi:proline dehydrogenase
LLEKESFNQRPSIFAAFFAQTKMISFDNTEIAFKAKTDKDLARAYFLFKVLGIPSVVRFGNQMVGLALRLGLPVNWLVKPTVYRHFVGGETLNDCEPSVRLLGKYGVRAILDYSVEGKNSPEDYRHALDETLRSIENAAKEPNIAFAVFKPSALISTEILERLCCSQLMSADELAEAENFDMRVETLCQRAYDLNVPLLIDAEYSWHQDYIDRLILKMMQKFNHQRAIVFNTLQMYRHDRIQYLQELIQTARDEGFIAGLKFVRGAYMETERERAHGLNYPSPIQPDKSSTDRDFNLALRISVENIDCTSVFCGSHNEESNALLVKLIQNESIDIADRRIFFSQLFGMSDHISFNLAHKGFNVAKYVPYGPVKHVIPYLSRRAEENTSVAGQSSRELRLIMNERLRRRCRN